jgi:hypothetical protein
MTQIRRIVIDVLKPFEPTTVEVAREVAACGGVEGVNVSLIETDQKVQNIKLTIEGADVDYDDVLDTIEELSGSVHSVDQVICGERIVEEETTLQDG